MAYTTINKSSLHINTKLYTGTGSSNAQTGIGFAPDFLAIKDRNGGASRSWVVVDNVRGATKRLKFDQTSGESTQAEMVKTLDSDGFTLGTTATSNNNGTNFVAYNWKANGAGSANTAGDLNSTVSVNTTAGFSIVTYSGTGNFGESVGHGLGVAPSMIIARRLNGVEDWAVYHKALGASKYIILNTIGAEQSSTSRWGGVAPTNSVFTVGNHASVNVGSGTHVAYCFAEKQGYSKFGTYTGNGNANGPFVYTGFKPAFVMIKLSTAADDWQIFDNKRNTQNVMDKYLRPNSPLDEITNAVIDFTSNGFKLRSSAGSFNPSGATAIYMAFAEAPLVGTNNIPATAR